MQTVGDRPIGSEVSVFASISVRRRLANALVFVLGLGLLAAAPRVSASGALSLPECPEIMATDQITKGMTGTGYTVSKGTEPEPFSVEVLGVLPDGVAPGHDMIVVEASSPAIDEAGVWEGMSGSPVYVDGKLIGAVAYGFTQWGPSPIAGLTPASDLEKVLNYPESSPASSSMLKSLSKRVELPEALADRVADAAGVTTTQVDSGLSLLPVPLAVSASRPGALSKVRRHFARQGVPVHPYTAASTNVPSTSEVDPSQAVPGGNFAAVLLYGTAPWLLWGRHLSSAMGERWLSAIHSCKAAALRWGPRLQTLSRS